MYSEAKNLIGRIGRPRISENVAEWYQPLAVRGRCSALNIDDADHKGLEIDPKDDPITTDAPAEGVLSCELHYISRERIGLLGAERRHDALLVSGGNALEISSRAVADGDGPAHGGVA